MRRSFDHLRYQKQPAVKLGYKGILVASLMIALTGAGFHLFAAWPAAEAVPPAKTQQAQALRLDRLATLRRRVDLVDQRYRTGSGSRSELLAAKRDVAEAELDTCAPQKERVSVLEKMVDDANILECQAAELARKNVATEEAALVIKADLLQLKIRLEEAQAALSRELQCGEEKPLLSQQLK